MGTSDAGDTIPGLDSAHAVDPSREVEEIFATGTAVERFADKAMYNAEPMPDLQPKVHLIWMTPDPLGAVAAMSAMYEGIVKRSLSEVTNVERNHYWKEMTKTHLNAPLESIKLHFMIEGVDRAFTHQMVRQRTAVYAQESLRFAVKANLAAETPKPPSFYDPRIADSPSKQNDLFEIWERAMDEIQRAYRALIAAGVPAEDARGLLPQATLTRLHYVTDLRNLMEHAGNRLCTQAQFHWRTVFLQIRECIRQYGVNQIRFGDHANPNDWDGSQDVSQGLDAWQFELIADTAFKPQCYLQGKCTFRADFDRGCTIRGRVDHFASKGVPPTEWGKDETYEITGIAPIDDSEWLTDPQAGWVR